MFWHEGREMISFALIGSMAGYLLPAIVSKWLRVCRHAPGVFSLLRFASKRRPQCYLSTSPKLVLSLPFPGPNLCRGE
jgi:hypothetical protein